jgi:UDP-N-acetylglucosamine 3-dehydrogenase
MSMDNFLRVGIIGSGKMGLLHASLLKTIPGVELAAVCEKSPWTRRFAKQVFRKIPVVKEVGELAGLDLDVIYVTTTTSSHFAVARQVFEEELARNVFIEKPLTAGYSDSKELCALASRNGGVNMVGYLRRFMVTFMKTRDLLSQGSIGKPLSFVMNAFSSDFNGVWGNSEASIARGGVMKDLGCYAVDLALWLFGDMKLTSSKVESLTGLGAEDAAHFTVKHYSNGLEGAVSVSWCMAGYRMPEVNLLVKGSNGAIEVDDDRVLLRLEGGKETVWHRYNLDDKIRFWLGAPEYYREDEYFISRVAAKSEAEPSFETAAKVDFFIDSIQRKARNLD